MNTKRVDMKHMTSMAVVLASWFDVIATCDSHAVKAAILWDQA